jgi:hypothetical protein
MMLLTYDSLNENLSTIDKCLIIISWFRADKFGLTAAQLEKLALGATEKMFGKADTQSFDLLR